jgi:hypothetical protein
MGRSGHHVRAYVRATTAATYKTERKEDTYLGARQHDLARHEDQKYDFGLDHAVDETREEL